MHKFVLIPIDFHVESLNTLKLTLAQCSGMRVSVMLMYAQELPSSISELLFYSPHRIIRSLCTPEFDEALEILRNRYSATIERLTLQLFHGVTRRAFETFVKSHGIHEIHVPGTYRLVRRIYSIDPMPFIRSSSVPVHEMAWDSSPGHLSSGRLDSLFQS